MPKKLYSWLSLYYIMLMQSSCLADLMNTLTRIYMGRTLPFRVFFTISAMYFLATTHLLHTGTALLCVICVLVGFYSPYLIRWKSDITSYSLSRDQYCLGTALTIPLIYLIFLHGVTCYCYRIYAFNIARKIIHPFQKTEGETENNILLWNSLGSLKMSL